MEVKIGVQHAPRELVVETADSAEEIEAALDRGPRRRRHARAHRQPRAAGSLVPARNIAYVEIGGGVSGQVGFRG